MTYTASSSTQAKQVYEPLTPKLAWQLAAPHTWPASILPALLATTAAKATLDIMWPLMSFALLVICVLMQSAVNTFNDYFDYVKGADSADDNVEVSDAVLVYNNVNPKSALKLAIGYLVVAFALGTYAIWYAGLTPLVIGLIGALCVVLYSGGKLPISYLPLGELVSGFVMGGLIFLACYQVLTNDLSFLALVWAIPTIGGIALIMFTNNTCDIEKDIDARRKTLSVMLGRSKAIRLYHAIVAGCILAIAVNVCVFFSRGVIILPFFLLASYPFVKALWNNPLVPASRIAAMSQICTVNVVFGAFYAAAMLA